MTTVMFCLVVTDPPFARTMPARRLAPRLSFLPRKALAAVGDDRRISGTPFDR
jgi:hypothetical protein